MSIKYGDDTQGLFSCTQNGATDVDPSLQLCHDLSNTTTALSFSNMNVCFLFEEDGFTLDSSETSIELARNLSLPLTSRTEWMADRENKFALMLVPYYYGNGEENATFALAIDSLPPATKRINRSKAGWKKQSVIQNAFFVDLCPPQASKAGRRATEASRSNDLLLKATMPWKGHATQSSASGGAFVVDMTAGFGQDSILLAMSGAERVHMVERNPIIAALLVDALRRLQLIAESRIAATSTSEYRKRHELANTLRSKLTLSSQDSRDWLMQNEQVAKRQNQSRNLMVYLDPMFPPRRNSAAVKKGMSILHDLLETQSTNPAARLKEEKELLHLALRYADLRVVVKRPINASPLGVDVLLAGRWDGKQPKNEKAEKSETTVKPSYSIEGSTNRWDIYVKQ
jgi:16S rRNA G966 N2-methylase RsmD